MFPPCLVFHDFSVHDATSAHISFPIIAQIPVEINVFFKKVRVNLREFFSENRAK